MLSYVWPKDRPDLRARVAISLGFLASAKVRAGTSLYVLTAVHLGFHRESFYLLLFKGFYNLNICLLYEEHTGLEIINWECYWDLCACDVCVPGSGGGDHRLALVGSDF